MHKKFLPVFFIVPLTIIIPMAFGQTTTGLTLTPSSGFVGTQVTFDTSGFFPRQLDIIWDKTLLTTTPVMNPLSGSFIVPSTNLGKHTITAIIHQCANIDLCQHASANFIVIPTPQPKNPSFSSVHISPTSIKKGQSFTAYYVINNPNSSPIQVGLGLSISPAGLSREIDDYYNDKVITVHPGSDTYSRAFTNTKQSPGLYDVAYGIWSGIPGKSTFIKSTGWISRTLTINP